LHSTGSVESKNGSVRRKPVPPPPSSRNRSGSQSTTSSSAKSLMDEDGTASGSLSWGALVPESSKR
jgi:hypothetical protein